jgi:hypothetical protein
MSIDILAALDSPELFQRWFEGPSWNAWRVVLKAAFALPMTSNEIEFFRSVAGRDPPKKRVRELWCVIGRSGGKDSIASLIAAYAGALFQPGRTLRPGERAMVSCLACDREQAKIVLDYTRSYFNEIPALKEMVVRENASGFELSNSVDVFIATNSPRAVRGRTVLCAILDECAFYRDEKTSTPDTELYRAIKPGLARMPNSMLIGISTPYRKTGLLYQIFQDYYGQNDEDDILVVRAPSVVFNPTLDQAYMERERRRDPAAMASEYEAQFRDDLSGWATRDLIEAAVDQGVKVRPPAKGVRYFAFADPSGGGSDSFTAAISHVEGDRIAVLDCLIEIKPGPGFRTDAAVAHIAGVLKSYGLYTVTGDHYAERWVVDAFAQHGITYTHSEDVTSAIYENALPLFSSGRVRLLDHLTTVSQFASLERLAMPGGQTKIRHPKGGHDDCANAVAGSLVLALSGANWFDLNTANRIIRQSFAQSRQRSIANMMSPMR